MAPADLLVPLEGQRQETLKILESCSDADLERVENGSGWTVRRIVAHLAAAEMGQAALIRLAAEGQVVHMSPEDRDAYNSSEIDKAENWDAGRLQARLKESRQALREAFLGIDEEDLDRAIRWPEWPARTIRSSIPYMLEHEDSHLDQVRRALELD
jgi:uncharacterized damage-inducible protein DinB